MMDPTVQYIDPGTPLSAMSNRNLPSPSEVKGESHILLMPFYQEIDIEENKRVVQQTQASQKTAELKRKQKELARKNRQLARQMAEQNGGDHPESLSDDQSSDSEKELQAILSQNPGGTGQASRGANRQQPAEVRDYALNRDELIVYKFDKKKLKQRSYGRNPAVAHQQKLHEK